MAYDEPGSRRRAYASKDIQHATFVVEDNFVGYANKAAQLPWNVAGGDAAAVTIEEDEGFVMMLAGKHPLALVGNLAGVAIGDPLWITDENEILTSASGDSTAEVQRITVDATGGNFTVNVDGEVTPNVSAVAVAATLQTAINNLSNVDPGDIIVTGGPGSAGGGTPYVLTFGGKFTGDQPQVTATGVSLTGGASTAVASTFTPGAAGDAVLPLGTVDEIDTSRTPDVALINLDNIRPHIAGVEA